MKAATRGGGVPAHVQGGGLHLALYKLVGTKALVGLNMAHPAEPARMKASI
jgi:hypothetical protein